VYGERDLCAVWTDFSEINDAHQSNIPPTIERILVGESLSTDKGPCAPQAEWPES